MPEYKLGARNDAHQNWKNHPKSIKMRWECTQWEVTLGWTTLPLPRKKPCKAHAGIDKVHGEILKKGAARGAEAGGEGVRGAGGGEKGRKRAREKEQVEKKWQREATAEAFKTLQPKKMRRRGLKCPRPAKNTPQPIPTPTRPYR